ncbi:MAG: hypothetical protein ACUVUB_06880 [Candidatus Bathyarchaeia archaeon]
MINTPAIAMAIMVIPANAIILASRPACWAVIGVDVGVCVVGVTVGAGVPL